MSSQHGSSQGEPEREDNDASHPSPIDHDDNGNSENASHGDFDRLAVDQQRKARRRANNQDMNKGGTGAKARRKNQRAQAQQIPHEHHTFGHGRRQQHQASAQQWNDFANAAQ